VDFVVALAFPVEYFSIDGLRENPFIFLVADVSGPVTANVARAWLSAMTFSGSGVLWDAAGSFADWT